MSIRTRLAIAVALMLVVTITLLGTVFVRSTRATLVDQVDQQVRANAERNLDRKSPPKDNKYGPTGGYGDFGGNSYGGNGNYGGSGGYGDYKDEIDGSASPTPQESASDEVTYLAVARFVYNAEGELVIDEPCGFSDDPKPPPVMPDVTDGEVQLLVNRIVTTPSVDGELEYRMLVQQNTEGETIVTASPLDTVDATIESLIRTLIVVGLVALVAATAASWWLIRRGMRPVDRMVDTAAAIAGGNLSLRVTDSDPRTELGRLGGALNEMLSQIETAVEARKESESRLRRFVADAAHELRTPLTSLRGYAELYRAGAIADEAGVTNAMGRIEAEGARMSRLVDDLLLLARMDQQRGLEVKPVDVVALANEAVADFQAVDPERPLTTNLSGPAVIQGDRIRLRQVIDNLLTNARIHTPAGTPVHVSVTALPYSVELKIADEGPGIAPEDQEKIFERFWRADPARARKTGGSGLGLSIVVSLAEAHGGSVAVESAPGKGTTFTVRIPKDRPAPAMPSSPTPPPT